MSRLVYEVVHSHYVQGWRVLASASVSYGKATPYFPVVDLLKRYVHVEDTDEPRTVRAKVTGQVLTLDETLQEPFRPSSGYSTPCPRTVPFARLMPRSAASTPSRRSNVCCCVRARYNHCSWSVRTYTGSIPRPRPCWTIWSRACPRLASCCWSTTP